MPRLHKEADMAEKQLSVKIISLQKTLFDGPAQSVYLPGTVGAFEVLPGHAAIISSLEKGKIVVRGTDGSTAEIGISSGVVKVLDNEVTVCAN